MKNLTFKVVMGICCDLFKLAKKFHNRIVKFRFQPIRVFCFHHVSESYDPLRMWECDWIQLEQFKKTLIELKKDYEFISIMSAYNHLRKDFFRRKKYAVLTSDDGYASLKNVLSWLQECNIPVALFLNAKYLDGRSYSPINEEQAKRADFNADMNDVVKGLFLTENDIMALNNNVSVEVASHGYEHVCSTEISTDKFESNVVENIKALEKFPRFVRFHAYTWGMHNNITDELLKKNYLIPVLIDGEKNYNDASVIHRESIDGMVL